MKGDMVLGCFWVIASKPTCGYDGMLMTLRKRVGEVGQGDPSGDGLLTYGRQTRGRNLDKAGTIPWTGQFARGLI